MVQRDKKDTEIESRPFLLPTLFIARQKFKSEQVRYLALKAQTKSLLQKFSRGKKKTKQNIESDFFTLER